MSAARLPSRAPRRARHAGAWIAAAFLALLAVAIAWPGLVGAAEPFATDPLAALLPPSAEHWFGTDELGRDLYARVVHGARYSVLIALAAVALGLVGGALLGLLAALGGRLADEVTGRLLDLLSAFPSILLALVIATLAGPGTTGLVVAVGVATVPTFGRIVRRQAIAVRDSDFVVAAVTFGRSRAAVLGRHVVPHVLSSVLLLAAIELGTAILTISGLSFVGLGPQRPAPEWGALLAEGREVLSAAWWPTVFPGAAITLTLLTVTTLGRHLQRRFERRLPA